MKKALPFLVVLALAGCGKKPAATPAADSTAAAAPAPAAGDSMAGMSHDSTMARDTSHAQ
jgi:predicted small lipoprotein YifL